MSSSQWLWSRTAAVIVAMAIPQSLFATNILFLPSDAFFATNLTEAVVKKLEADATPEFGYRGPEWIPGNFCGYSGYDKLTYPEMPAGLRKQLGQTYEKLRENYPQQIEIRKDEKTGAHTSREINGFLTLIYNSDYDIKRYGLLAKYNEHWPKEARGNRVGDSKGIPGYPALGTVDSDFFAPFLNDARFVMREWQFASDVSAIRVRLPEKLETEGSGFPKNPVIASGPMIFVILPQTELKLYDIPVPYQSSDPLDRPFVEFYVISERGSERWELDNDNGWESEPWNAGDP